MLLALTDPTSLVPRAPRHFQAGPETLGSAFPLCLALLSFGGCAFLVRPEACYGLRPAGSSEMCLSLALQDSTGSLKEVENG
jgi:hypothetical protein